MRGKIIWMIGTAVFLWDYTRFNIQIKWSTCVTQKKLYNNREERDKTIETLFVGLTDVKIFDFLHSRAASL